MQRLWDVSPSGDYKKFALFNGYGAWGFVTNSAALVRVAILFTDFDWLFAQTLVQIFQKLINVRNKNNSCHYKILDDTFISISYCSSRTLRFWKILLSGTSKVVKDLLVQVPGWSKQVLERAQLFAVLYFPFFIFSWIKQQISTSAG